MTNWRWTIPGLAAVLIAVAPAGDAAEGKWRLLVDFTEDSEVGMSAFKPPKPMMDTMMKLAGARKYYAGEDQCKEDDPMAVFLGAQQIEGRFLPNGEQLLVHYSTGACNEGHRWTRGHLMLLQDGKVVANLSPECASRIDAIVETVGSNLQRVVLGCGGTGQGHTISSADMFGYRNGKFRLIHDLGTVYADDCGAKEEGTETVSVVYEKKSDGELRIKNYARSCASQANGIKDYRFLYNGPMRE